MALQVIGTGHGRTGTNSLKLALEQLGFGKCYHMLELLNNPDNVVYFEKASAGEAVDWDKVFEGYHSACDFPIILFMDQLVAKYPDAKYIHTTRDADGWYKSFNDTIMKVSGRPPLSQMLKTMVKLPFSSMLRKRLRVLKYNGKMFKQIVGERMKSKQGMIDHFNEYNAKTLNTVPKDRLLIYDVKSGWEPLCSFLNVPIPSTPFPKVNSTEEFVERAKTLL